ncbi:MAG: TraB/GumN family protein [bacterium]|nr:TraB/GumN family protein [bacterium]
MNLSITNTTVAILFALFFINTNAQVNLKQKGLLWEITGNGLKKPSYVYGTMHISSKLAFHLGDSFYLSLLKCDMVALEQNLDSVIHRWISEDEDEKPEDADKVGKRNVNEYLNLNNFKLSNYDKGLIKRKLSAEVREVNYLLKRGNEDNFEEDAWLDLYIYQLGKRLGKEITGVEGYEESRDLVEKSNKEPESSKKETKKKLKSYSYKMRDQVSEAYRKGNIFMIDSIDRMTESEYYREYMLYKRNENMVRRMDSIIKLGKTLFTGVGCAHLPGKKGVLQMLADLGYKVRPVQSLANEKSKLAEKYENMTYAHKYKLVKSDDDLLAANLPTKLTKVRDNNSYSSYLSPDLANGYYYQIEKISSNSAFSGKSQQDILMEIDTLIFENIPGDVKAKKMITSNGFPGIEIVTELKTGDLNRFQILASPFNVYIVRMSGKKKFATSSEADAFFKSLKINEGNATQWRTISSGDSVFSLLLPTSDKTHKLPLNDKIDPTFEHIVFEKATGSTYLIKQIDFLNDAYMEEDSFELGVMAKSFSLTDDYNFKSRKQFNWQGYHALDVTFEGKSKEKMYARFVIVGTRYIMFLLKPGANNGSFEDKYFTSIKFNGKPDFKFFNYKDTNIYYTVSTPVKPFIMKNNTMDLYYDSYQEEEIKPTKYDGKYQEMYFKTDNASDFIVLGAYRFGYYERQAKKSEEYYKEWEKTTSVKITGKSKITKNKIDYYTYNYTDTNTNKRVKMMTAENGLTRYYLTAFVDTIAGKSAFVDAFFKTFDVSDTAIAGNIHAKKGPLFFSDFTSSDSLTRLSAIKYFKSVEFFKSDIKDIQHMIDTISSKSAAARLKVALIFKLGFIDSADSEIVPYLQKLYAKTGDTAYMQMEILQAIAHQRSDIGYKAIKPILSTDIPISDNKFEMENLLYAFNDTLKLTKSILPELLDLTTIAEYRHPAYNLISQMKDSGIITLNDYTSIHNRLITEARIEYKRNMASLTKEDNEGSENYDYYDGGYSDYDQYSDTKSESVFNSILNLALPLRKTNPIMQSLTDKILDITDNKMRLELLPVLLKNGVDYKDSVYERLAKTETTRLKFYNILLESKQLKKFPKGYKSQKLFVLSNLKQTVQYGEIDSTVLIEIKTINLGKKAYLMYIYKYRFEEEEDWNIYTSNPMPTDTSKIFDSNDYMPFYSTTDEITESRSIEKIINEILFDTNMRYVRERNGGYYEGYYGRRSDIAYSLSDY